MKKFGLTLLTAFVGGAMALGAYKVIENKYASNMSFEDKQKVYYATSNHLTPSTSATNLSSAGQVDFTEAAAAVTPAVVYIRTTYASQSDQQESQMQKMFGEMFGQRVRPSGPQMASGSGVIISPDGYIVTNNHVVDKAEKIDIVTNDHQTYQAKIIGTDPNTDLALIKIDAHNMPIVKLGNSDNVKVGEWVLAVGNPFKLTSTVTAGIVSAKGRGLNLIGNEDEQENPFGRTQYQSRQPRTNKAIESFIQTDAAINPGNSGGALVNTNGELIGINSAIASHTGSYEGYGFAIPINLAKKVLDDIEKFGAVKRGYLGLTFKELDQDYAKELGISRTYGLYVKDVMPASGAEAAGVKGGDIITKIEGNTIYESSDLQERVGRLAPGDKVHITVLRDGAEKNLAVTLKADAGTPKMAASKSGEELFNKIGASFTPLNAAQKAKFHVSNGVLVTQVREGGLFDNTEIPEGSVITQINRQPISTIDDLDRALSNPRNGILVISGLSPDGTKLRVALQVE
ncbi:Do family serine endopeptidase [Mucilaginibacter flavidus]|uniref:Do family serine endopeptidase n=1 Tax=Mucilaginibacter flavidus TaxID=2949309 RepID=UPI0020934D4B|nr:Do family serine endopeptidase [Mucilaginibacter flavidus]MCO5945539.1 Do family serine endopeptidase [Mucilaginibacter flavidus]